MSLRINNNTDALVGHRNLETNEMNLSKSLERLSSGLRINRAADDAAGLVISEQMRAQISGLNQASSNSETAVSMVQTAEGALDEVNSLLNKARTLALHSANDGANDSNQLAADQNELDNVLKTINRIGDVTQFGTKKLLDGSLNGATTLQGGLQRVKVGNLANNSAIAAGQMSVSVTGYIKEANTLKGGSTDTSSGFVFTSGVVGMKVGTGHLRSGSKALLTIGGASYSYTATGSISATGIADKLNAKLNAQSGGYTVAYASTGGYTVTRSAPGATDFTASLTFSRDAILATPGTDESVTASVTLTAGTNATSAALLFSGVSSLSGVTASTVIGNTGSVYTAVVSTATGQITFVTTGTKTDKLSDVLGRLQAGIRAQSLGTDSFSTATMSLVTSPGVATGFQVKLARGNDALHQDFNFKLSVDYKNSAGTTPQIVGGTLNAGGNYTTGANGTFQIGTNSGVATVSGGATTLLKAGSAIEVTINGTTKIITGAGQSLNAIATTLQGQFGGTYKIAYFSGTSVSGNASFVGSSGSSPAVTAKGFYATDTSGKVFTMSLRVDQKVGTDHVIAETVRQAGKQPGATLDLDTKTQTRVQGVTTLAGTAAVAINNASGSTANVNGTNGSGTLTTSSGLQLGLVQSNLTASGSATYVLSPTATAAGYQDLALEFDSAVSKNGGTSTFSLTTGAKFQIGANAGQYVGVTIDAVSASELGRNVTGAGTLTSLNDMLSSEQSALTTGKADSAIKVIDAAINQVTNLRGKLGGFQSNTLESGLSSLKVSNENLTAAESTIRDTDFASESANFTKTQILVQASTAMLAQANQLPQNVLSLLK